MKINIYTVYDKVAKSHSNTIWVAPSDVVAVRQLGLEVNRSDATNNLYHNPQDFVLKRIGTFDTDTGLISDNAETTIVCEAEKLTRNTDNKERA